jgi:outer membrane biosynthesis protein TonB
VFNQLIASQPVRGRGRGYWGFGNLSVSLFLHLGLLAGAVYATQSIGEEVEQEEEEVTFVEVEEAPPPPEPPPAEDLPPPPQGFQELIPPVEPPSFIPDISESLAPVNLADFSGIGTPQGIANVVPEVEEVVVQEPGFAYSVEVLDVQPRLINADEVVRAMGRLYPRLLLQAGIGGVTRLRFVVQEDGTVDMDPSRITVVETTNEEFAAASREALRTFRFQPGVFRGANVRSLVEMPINWTTGN